MAISEKDNNRHFSHSDKGPGDWDFTDFIGISPSACEVREQLKWLAAEPGANSILITGESGVGKDLAAKILHSQSLNVADKKNFVHVDCGAFNDDHVRSELFGHVKGSFTGAEENRKGCFRRAADGTVFLNEIGNIPLTTQAVLLHVLDDPMVKPLGSDEEIKVNPVMIFATNADLELMIEQGTFRNDLLKRMQHYQLHIAPLRERPEDIAPLTDLLYSKLCLRSKTGLKPRIDKKVYCLLSCNELRGNVRELENLLIMAFTQMRRRKEEVLMPHHFCSGINKVTQKVSEVTLTEQSLRSNFRKELLLYIKQYRQINHNNRTECIFDLPEFIEEIESVFLQEEGGKKAIAAMMLGIDRRHYYKKRLK